MLLCSLMLSAAALGAEPGELAPDLEKPARVQAAGKPLDVQRSGHSAPFFGDVDGDGLPDLLVGQFHEGKLRVYRNVGSKGKPRFDGFTWLQAGGADVSVPVG